MEAEPGPPGAPASILLLAAAALPLAAACGPPGPPEAGVPRELARWRAEALEEVRYELRLDVPASPSEPVRGRETLRFVLRDLSRPLALDFTGEAEDVRSIRRGGREIPYRVVDEHVLIDPGALAEGENELVLRFVAGDGPLNRNPDYLYTLFVPERAREVFPCFDQPDLKARFRLTLEIPAGWKAVSNTPVAGERRLATGGEAGEGTAGSGAGVGEAEEVGSGPRRRRLVRFGETRPLPTYLFSFAAGRFRVEEAERHGRTYRMYHRETDSARVARNRAAAFDLHDRALRWLERYTGIEYPFEKFDFVLVPSFQYNGMEHPGAVLYRASSVLLGESPTQNERLGRASLIAHETAHMWFGDLVTMEWFDDVWTKEVYANFMAAKIVHPSFPEVDHRLRFLLAHYPSAYAVDRSEGTHPIRQELGNLSDASSLYGAIIYQKAPIVMRQLERLMGEEELRDGLRTYLDRHRFANASWPDLIALLDERTDEDVSGWDRMWVEEAGRPTVRVAWTERAADGSTADRGPGRAASAARRGSAPTRVISALRLRQSDPEGRGRTWPQDLRVGLGYPDSVAYLPARIRGRVTRVEDAGGRPVPGWILPNGGGVAYGRFALDSASREALLEGLPGVQDPMTRAAGWLTLWDGMLGGSIPPARMLELELHALRGETEELLVERILSYLESTFWRYLRPSARGQWASRVEEVLWDHIREAEDRSLKVALFRTYRSVALGDRAVARLRRIWERQEGVTGMALSERDYSDLAQALAVRRPDAAARILERQAGRIDNPDRRERFRWVMPSLSPRPAVRDSFFRALANPSHRRHEPWVLEGLSHLHHPLREEEAVPYVRPALELLREVKATGDIFFPKGWLDATFRGHGSSEVAGIVRDFLRQRPDYPRFLEDKLLQAADPVFRAARVRSTRPGGGK